jgi:hypothetical protein
MGADDAQSVQAKLDAIRAAGPNGAGYRFNPGQALNVDASDDVCTGGRRAERTATSSTRN